MKKLLLILVFGLFLVNLGCGGSSNGGSGTTAVTITLGNANSSSAAGAVTAQQASQLPPGVATVRITVSADDIRPSIVKTVDVTGLSSVTVTIDVPNGPSRLILIEAMDSSGNVLFRGEEAVNLDGTPLAITMDMESTSTTTCDLFVNVDTGTDRSNNCTDAANPCKTITYALTQTAGNEEICVAGGTYNTASGESFPLTLKRGATLNCEGANHSTLINGSGSRQNTIEGAAGATIRDCTILVDSGTVSTTTGVDDKDNVIIVDDCIITPAARTDTNNGILLSADSTVRNSTISEFRNGGSGGGIGISVSRGNPTISNNTLSRNTDGIFSISGDPGISNNTITANTSAGIIISSGSPSITGNTVSSNLFEGIIVAGGTPSITNNNTITSNATGILVSAGNPTINNNTLTCNTGVDLQNLVPNVDARNNRWDRVPPDRISGTCLNAGEDVCSPNADSIDTTGAELAPARCDAGPVSVGLNVSGAGRDRFNNGLDNNCRNINSPCRTLTQALSQTSGSEEIRVAGGNYSIDAGETFPLTLKPGTTLNCQGGTIDGSGSSSDTIIGATGAMISGCTIIVSSTTTNTPTVGINNNGNSITVTTCSISPAGKSGGNIGISVQSNAVVTDSIINNFTRRVQCPANEDAACVIIGGIGITVNGSPTLSGNKITGNDTGIEITGGNPIINNNNTLSCNSVTDLLNNTDNDIEAKNNLWDNQPPVEACAEGGDVCNTGEGSIITDPSTRTTLPCSFAGEG